jgi:hypothetical protein
MYDVCAVVLYILAKKKVFAITSAEVHRLSLPYTGSVLNHVPGCYFCHSVATVTGT